MSNEKDKEVEVEVTGEPMSLEEMEKADGVSYQKVAVYGGVVLIGSLGSGDLLEWFESNDDPASKKEAGLRLIVKAVCDGKTKARLPRDPENRDKWLGIYRAKDARQNGTLVKAILKHNGLDTAAKKLTDAPKDDSSATGTGDSPSA